MIVFGEFVDRQDGALRLHGYGEEGDHATAGVKLVVSGKFGGLRLHALLLPGDSARLEQFAYDLGTMRDGFATLARLRFDAGSLTVQSRGTGAFFRMTLRGARGGVLWGTTISRTRLVSLAVAFGRAGVHLA